MSDSNDNPDDSRARSADYSPQAVLLYKISAWISYLVLLVTAVFYTFHAPNEAHGGQHRFWQHQPATPFAQNSVITSIYWLIIFATSLITLTSVTLKDTSLPSFLILAPHTIPSSLLLFAFIHLWVRSHFYLAELVVVLNFFNLSVAYFRHPNAPRLLHIGSVAGPLAWNFVALYWVGAVAVGAHGLAARILANVVIWGWVGYGVFFLAAYKDYVLGFALSVLAFSTGVGQFLTKLPILQLQWIFAFTIGGLLFVLSLAVGVPGLMGRDLFPRGQIVSEDRERAPLLADD